MNRDLPKTSAKKTVKRTMKKAPRRPAKKAEPRSLAASRVKRSTESSAATQQAARNLPVGAVGLVVAPKTAPMKPLKLAPKRPASYDALAALGRVVEVLGKSGTASVLGVSKAQPGRWLSREERMSPKHQTAIKELDGFLNLVLNVFTPNQAAIWLFSTNSFLGQAAPMDVFRLRGLTAVAPAISGFEQGVYA